MRKLITVLLLASALTASGQIKYTPTYDPSVTYEGTQAVLYYIRDNPSNVGGTICLTVGLTAIISEVAHDRKYGCKIRWRDRRKSKRRIKRRR